MAETKPKPLQKLTNSRRVCAQVCLQKHHFAYELGLRRIVDAQPLRFGEALHVALNAVAKGVTQDDAILVAVASYDETRPPSLGGAAETDWLLEGEILARLLAGYFWRWGEADKDVEILASEVVFNLPLLNPETERCSRTWTMDGRIDKVLRRDGPHFVREHKTTGSGIEPDADYWKRLRIDSQVSVYWLAAQELGWPVEHVEYDVIRKPGIRPKKLTQKDTADVITGTKYCGEVFAVEVVSREPLKVTINGEYAEIDRAGKLPAMRETVAMYGARLTQDIGERPDYYYARRQIPRTADNLMDARHELWQMAGLLQECRRSNRWPRATHACIGYGRCPYFDLCTNGFDFAASGVPAGFEIVANVNPELSQD